MHLQIRKKEGYLLLSMVLYLLIVSSALFLIFSPVNAWSELTEFTVGNSLQVNSKAEFISVNNCSAFTREVTRIHYVGDFYRNTGDNSGTYPVSWTIGGLTGTGSVTWSTDAGTYSWGTVTADIYIDNLQDSSSTGQCAVYPNVTFFGTSLEYFKYQENYAPLSKYSAVLNSFAVAYGGTYTIYGGGETPDVPVINSVTSFPDCLEPGTGVVLESNVTGTVDDWTWEIYDQNDVSVFTGNSPIEQMVDLYLLSPGDYNVQLTVENSGGSDFWQQDDFLHINQSGTCNFTVYDPFPTVTVTPTIQVYPTLTLPAIVDTNMTGINTEIDELWIIGNMSEGYREMVDYYGEGVNATFTGLVGIIVSPFTFIANAVSTGSALFSTSYASLMSYTTIPLAIVGITLSYYPWQIITLITAGIAIDAIFVLIFGVR